MKKLSREDIKEILRKVKLGELTEEEGADHLCDDEDESEEGEASTNDAGPPTGGGPRPGGGNP